MGRYNFRKRPIKNEEPNKSKPKAKVKPKRSKVIESGPLTPPPSEQEPPASLIVKHKVENEVDETHKSNDGCVVNSDVSDSDTDESKASLRIPKKANPNTYITYDYQTPVYGYQRVNVGNAFITRNIRKRCKQEGYDLYEYNSPSGYKNYTKLTALFAPRHIVKEVTALDVVTKAKRAKARKSSEAKERKQAWQSFDKLFPGMPESEREAVFERAFEKRSGRIGHKKGFSMDEKINLATRAYVKYEYTDFESLLEDARSDLYDELLGEKDFMDRDIKNYAYEEFNYRKAQLYDETDEQVQRDIDQKIREWK